jgi:hypothetical protein
MKFLSNKTITYYDLTLIIIEKKYLLTAVCPWNRQWQGGSHIISLQADVGEPPHSSPFVHWACAEMSLQVP